MLAANRPYWMFWRNKTHLYFSCFNIYRYLYNFFLVKSWAIQPERVGINENRRVGNIGKQNFYKIQKSMSILCVQSAQQFQRKKIENGFKLCENVEWIEAKQREQKNIYIVKQTPYSSYFVVLKIDLMYCVREKQNTTIYDIYIWMLFKWMQQKKLLNLNLLLCKSMVRKKKNKQEKHIYWEHATEFNTSEM